MTDPRPSRVDTARLLPVLGFVVIVALVLSVATGIPWTAAVAVGIAAGAAAAIVWRRARGESPFEADSGETLRLR